jgi:mycothiol synthase
MRRVHVEPHVAHDDDLAHLAERFEAGDPDLASPDVLEQLAVQARTAGATALVVEAEPATGPLDAAAAAAGFALVRTTLQLRRPLPVEETARVGATPIDTRPFRPGIDEEAWLAVNNRAFAWHPDQSGQTRADLERLEREPWFRVDGFLVHEDADRGAIDGFCWTKIHADHDPPLGEIYVIGVDPEAHGRGLGRSLVLAGLDWLSGQQLETGMLYVEADNEPARHLYATLGFVEHHTHRWWRLDL